jgi:uncharacterized Zn finger protein
MIEDMLTKLLTEDFLEELAGERAFERGEEYFADGLVDELRETNGAITARVRGTYDYRVKLWAEGDELAFACTCPVGQRSEFCKHCVAVGLEWIDRRRKNGGVFRPAAGEVTDEDIRSYLMRQDKTALAELVLGHCELDSEFRDRLVLITAEKAGKKPDLAVLRAALDKAIRHRGFVDYRAMPAYARGIENVIDSLETLLQRGHAKAARELSERALQRMESAMNEVDDSDGYMGQILDRLQKLHLAACQVEKPEPQALAKLLIAWELNSEWEIFLGAAETYAGVLGTTGLALYRKFAEARWAKVPALAPGNKDPQSYGSRWRITRVMETLAGLSGDIEALVAVKARDLSHAFAFLQIAQSYKDSGHDEKALEWAERGLRAFPEHTDSRLREFLIEEYHRRKRHGEAIAIAWMAFCERPGLEAYRILNRSASRAKQWAEWREKALARLRGEITSRRQPRPLARWAPPAGDHSELVEIFLWEGDPEAAWTEARNGGCHNGLWSRLAEAREKEHPADALKVYVGQLKRALQPTQQQAYKEAVGVLRRIHPLKARIGKEIEFAALVQSVRAQYKARRNLMKLLDAEGW